MLKGTRLCHNVHGPHDATFHALWNELRDEWTTLQLKGYTGEGFLGKGNQLGGSHIPRDELRRRARAEAIKERDRRKAQQAKSGHRLGGAFSGGGSLRDAIADATIRRTSKEVESGCATGTKAGERAAEDAMLNGFRSKAEMDEADHLAIQQALFELMQQEEGRRLDREAAATQRPTAQPVRTQSVSHPIGGFYAPTPPSAPNPRPAATYPGNNVPARPPQSVDRHGRPISRLVKEAESKSRNENKAASARLSKPLPKVPGTSQGSSSQQPHWPCPRCTLQNEANVEFCDACNEPRMGASALPRAKPQNIGSNGLIQTTSKSSNGPGNLGWKCWFCGTFMEHQWWTCSRCGTMKASS
jgi:DNA-dependent metalloprotease WSS1